MRRIKSQAIMFVATVLLTMPVIFFTKDVVGRTQAITSATHDIIQKAPPDSALEVTAKVSGIIVAASTLIGLLITGLWSLMRMLLSHSESKTNAISDASMRKIGDSLECEIREVKNLILTFQLTETERFHRQNEAINGLTIRIEVIEKNADKVTDIEQYLISETGFIKRGKRRQAIEGETFS